ncbi:hypothetical protein CFOLD11_12760 [Clostridium folliculivorans]|uniref:CAAX prenyl protease 2/Lysostaphin resistance protein A-like domain-containing protein n=1 Tax=Clostridium folliculivorans TaxID=2886038 RepID=A0A9W6D9L8_9CLOT|nr:CPBP family intramembrane glutamic endopeptidase [Clostridium folliculivorans]GKU24450.1 hypothetical protein CFOLD11_12760 [Clostridium folliculivorans]
MMKTNIKTALIPLIIILVGSLTAMIASKYINAWAFIPLAIVYWASIIVVVKPTKNMLKSYLKKPAYNFKISIVSLIPVLLCSFSFIWGIKYIETPSLIIMWIIFAVINSFTEEIFWRGYLIDNLTWKPSIKVIYTTILFSLSHPLMWGVFSITIRSYIMVLPLLTMGLIWGYVYHKTKSLRWCILAHFLVDLLNLSVWVFLNIYIPPVIK